MTVYFIQNAGDYIGGVPSANAVMITDANGRWSQSTSPTLVGLHMTGTLDLKGVLASNVNVGNSLNAAGVNASTHYGNNITAVTLSAGARVVYANASRLAFWSVAPVDQQASLSVLYAAWSSVDGASSATVMLALNALGTVLNALGTKMNNLGLTA